MYKIVKLSYDIDEGTPLYPGTPPLKIEKVKEINKGDSCNTSLITFSNHSGTHIDAPRHFLDSGKGTKDYPANKLVYKKPVIIDCPKRPGEVVLPEDLSGLRLEKDVDALLIRTGSYKHRSSEPEKYRNENPSISPEAADWIRRNLLNLKIVGIDSISISSKMRKGDGVKAHKTLLTDKEYRGDPVLILEDLYLPSELKRVGELLIFPVFKADIDSSPCVVIGLIDE